MDNFQEYVLLFLENSNIKYLADGEVKTMSIEYFQKSFTRIAAIELPNNEQCYFYYQNIESSELVMCFRILQPAGIALRSCAIRILKNIIKNSVVFK